MFFSSKPILLLLLLIALDTFTSSLPIGEGNGNADKAVEKKSSSTGRVGNIAKGVLAGALLATAGSLAHVANARPVVETNDVIATQLVSPPPSIITAPPVQEIGMRRRANAVRKDVVPYPNVTPPGLSNAPPAGFEVPPLPPGGFNRSAPCGKKGDGTPMGPCGYVPIGTTGMPDEYKVNKDEENELKENEPKENEDEENEDEDKGWCC